MIGWIKYVFLYYDSKEKNLYLSSSVQNLEQGLFQAYINHLYVSVIRIGFNPIPIEQVVFGSC